MSEKRKRLPGVKRRPLPWNITSFALGMAFNLGVFLLTIWLVYVFSQKFYKTGGEIAQSMLTAKGDKEIDFIVSEGDSADDIAARLEKDGIINNALLFRLENLLKGVSRDYKPGTYTLNASMDTSEINAIFNGSTKQAPVMTITIIEGSTTYDIAQYLEKNGVVKAADFITACNEHEFKYDFLADVPKRENRLEGYLFPDTYYLTADADSDEIINKLLTRFDEIYTTDYANVAQKLGKTMDEIITIASIIEKEIKVADERVLCSEVIYNRLGIDMALQIDATVLYALGEHKDRLTLDDLEVDSPYNTYRSAGLPPGPISNPGERCILAALTPAKGDYLYYVVKDTNTGEHFFTNNYDDFQTAKELYIQGN